MRWLSPKTLAGRVVLVLVAGLTVSHLLSMAILSLEGLADSSPWSPHALSSLGLMTAGVILFSLLVARWMTRPLTTFAAAADRLGRDVDAPPLPETGPEEIRQAAHAFNRMQERLKRFVEDRTRMLAAISHDLRTPITLLRLRAEFMIDEEERQKMAATLDEMEAMITSTLAFARDDAAEEERRTVDLPALIGSICDDLLDAGEDVRFDPPGPLHYACRPLALKRALANLIGNAVKYGANARVVLAAADKALTIAIQDDGPGIPESEMDKVFNPFYRIEGSRSRETGGAGLGLGVARTIIHAHGGEIRLENRTEGGLTAIVELPR